MKVGARVRLRERRHGRVPLPGRRVLVPRDEHPPPGGALRHRDGHVARPRRRAAARRRRASRSRSRQDRHRAARSRDRVPHQRRGPGDRASSRPPARSPTSGFPAAPACAGTAATREGDDGVADYDNLVGKLVVWAPDREAAPRAACCARSASSRSAGIATTIPAHKSRCSSHPDFAAGTHSTKWVEDEVDAAAVRRARRARLASAAEAAQPRRARARSSRRSRSRSTASATRSAVAPRGAPRRRRHPKRRSAPGRGPGPAVPAARRAAAPSARRCRARS